MTNAQKMRQNITKQAKKPAKKAVAKNVSRKTATVSKSVSVNNANAYALPAIRYRISDPVLLEMNRKAYGYSIPPNLNIGVRAMPKGTYGLANGHIILMPSDARTSGGITGTGGIGTGTSIGITGASGPAMQVNGKNPYAASGIYGDRTIGIYQNNFIRDSLSVLSRNKQ